MEKHPYERRKPFVRVGTIGHVSPGRLSLTASVLAMTQAVERAAHKAAMVEVIKRMEPEHKIDISLSARQQRKARKAAKRAATKEGTRHAN